jgi:hypothetical protein
MSAQNHKLALRQMQSEAYHHAVFDRLTSATKGLSGEAYSDAFRAQLDAIARDVSKPGSVLNSLVTRP